MLKIGVLKLQAADFCGGLVLKSIIFALILAGIVWGAPKSELLSYNIRWGFITAGTSTMELAPYQADSTKPLSFPAFYQDSSASIEPNVEPTLWQAQWITTGPLQWLYPVNDTITTLFAQESFRPFHFHKRLNEGSFYQDATIDFDWQQDSARLSDVVYHDRNRTRVKRSSDSTVHLDSLYHTITSAFYMVRYMDLDAGKEHRFSAVSGKKKYELRVVVHGSEKVKVPAGTFDCWIVEPIAEDEVFRKQGSLRIWISKDERRLPVLMKSKIAVGSITAEMTSVQ
jgi:hypothetical protein